MEETYKVLWNDKHLLSFTQTLIQSDSSSSGKSLAFWYEDDNGDLKISRHILVSRFYPALGVRNLVLGRDASGMETALPVFINGNRVEEVSAEVLKSITFKVIDFYGELTGDINTAEQVRTAIAFSKALFEKSGIRAITDLYDKQPLTDTPTTAYRFFKNGFVEITKEGVTALRDYNELPDDKIIWNNSVINRDYLFATDVTASLDAIIQEGKHPETGEYIEGKRARILLKEYKQKYEEEQNTPRDAHRDFVTNLR